MPHLARQLVRQGVDLAFKAAETGLRLALTGAGRAVRLVTGDGAAEQAATPEHDHASDPLASPVRGRGASPPHPAGEPGRRTVPPSPQRRDEEPAAEHTATATTQDGGETATAEPPAPEPAAAEPPPATGPPSAAEAVEAEFAEQPAWQPDETAAVPPDPSLETVDEGTALAGESADPGAEEGAGAEVRVAPPWPGYDRLRARDIVDRLTGADRDLAAAVRLYEASTKARKTVLEAAERAGRG